jgi:polysaccharide export outer membrane protein
MRTATVFVRACASLVLALGTIAAPVAAQETQASQEYVLGAGDVVEVSVLGRDDFKTRARVRTDGAIVLPFLGEVPAANRTPGELGEAVQAALKAGGYFANPVVNVEMVAYTSRYVTVLGVVARPGLVPIDRAYRISEILARAGGAGEGAADHLIVTSPAGEERRFSIEAVATGGPSEDPMIAAGDKVYVPKAEQFFIYGQVNSPGAYQLMSEPTLRKAIARGGGITAAGNERKVQVFRKGQQVSGIGLTEAIQPGDVVVVGERLF